MHISVVGLGRLGSAFAASAANSGIPVTGIDIDSDIVETLRDGRAPFDEPRLNEYIRNADSHLEVTTDASSGVPGTDLSFIFVNTYHSGQDGYSLGAVENAVRDVGRAIGDMDHPHQVVLRSTVMPGDVHSSVLRWLEDASGQTVGDDLRFCYWPEMTALGNIIDSIETPAFRLIGEHTPEAGDRLEAFIRRWIGDESDLVRTDITSAAVAKMGINTYVANKMSFANNLSQICDGIGADVDEVTRAMCKDPRISGQYFTGGVRYGGPCFPHDNVAFEALADRAGTVAPLARASDRINDQHTDWIVEKVSAVTPDDSLVAVLGLTYKPGVRMVRASQGMDLIDNLTDRFETIGYDAIAADEAEQKFDDSSEVWFSDDLDAVIASADTVVTTLRDGAISDPSVYTDVTIVDPWRMFNGDEFNGSVDYQPLGRSR